MSAPIHPHLPPVRAPRPPEALGARRGVAMVAVALGALLLSAPAWATPTVAPASPPATVPAHATSR